MTLAVFATQETNAFLPKIFGNGGNNNKNNNNAVVDENMVGGRNNKNSNTINIGGIDNMDDGERLKSLII